MKVEGSYTIHASRDHAWLLLIDPEVISKCISGCETLEEKEPGIYNITLKAGVGSIKGVFTGTIRLDNINEPEHYRMIVDCKGSPGFIRGEGSLDVIESGDGTIVNYVGDVSVGGTLASVGQRMIQATSKMMAGNFFAAIEAEAKAWQKAEENNEPYKAPKHGFFRNTIRQIKK